MKKETLFQTKARTLVNLKGKVSGAAILDQLYFTVEEWQKNKTAIVALIQRNFKDAEEIVARSSALGEDTESSSMAGEYTSVLRIRANDKNAIVDAIEVVKKSYEKTEGNSIKNEILIQPFIKNVVMSGVMFTRDINTGAPYFVVNYDDRSGSTDSVTSGNGDVLKIFTFYKESDRLPSNARLASLIGLARELEVVTGLDALDIEFAFDDKQTLYLLQVRPITTVKSKSICLKEFKKELEELRGFFNSHNVRYPNLFGYRAMYGVMPDWNPAEIIGINPRPLALSLYKELITDYIWPLSRAHLGYRDIGYQPGIVSFGGKPYIDVRMSFNTFLPQSISIQTGEKLINFYLDKLMNNPELHDKVEFQVVYTIYPFSFEDARKELERNNFSPLQIKEIETALRKLTDDIVNEKVVDLDKELGFCGEMNKKREDVRKADIPLDAKIAHLIHDCKFLGTLPFSKLARCAFIGNILMRSLLKKGVISEEEHARFFGSIETVAGEFVADLQRLKQGDLPKKDFLARYGHLRPGTYEITSLSYAENFENYISLKNIEKKEIRPKTRESHFSSDTMQRINEEIKGSGFSFSAEQFINFASRAIEYRERAKFEFTKNISALFESVQQLLPDLSRDELSFLTIYDIISFNYASKPQQWVSHLKEIIEQNKKKCELTTAISLPPLLYIEQNFDYFHMMDDQPNYVTAKKVTGDVVYVPQDISERPDLTGKIVLIENADPGYDWIFSQNINGLITKYGGTGSHMSIRAAEFQLPAAIGCGSYLFDYVKGSEKIELNCGARQIKRIH